VEVNAVATRVNVQSLDALVGLSLSLGVDRCRISPFIPPLQRPAAAHLSLPGKSLEAVVEPLRQKYGPYIRYDGNGENQRENASPEQVRTQRVCEVGLRTLEILPDGQVTRCHFLPDHKELYAGSVREQTLLEIWESDRLTELNTPLPDRFEGTACAPCAEFHACNARGRCYLSSYQRLGRVYGPDTYCGMGGYR
jgi:radical SAM protein with 4Fe4S-binding SPASM domain